MIKIEKNKPLVPRSGGRKVLYPFQEMEILDAFLIPTDKKKSVRSCAQQYGRKHRKKFSVRWDPETDCWYCWRIA